MFLVLHKNGVQMGTHQELLLTIAFTTVCWLITAYAGPETDRDAMINFYLKVKPFGPGWTVIRKAAGVSEAQAAEFSKEDNIPLATLGWVAGTTVIWAGLFTVGNFLYGRTETALILLGVLLASGAVLISVTKRYWK